MGCAGSSSSGKPASPSAVQADHHHAAAVPLLTQHRNLFRGLEGTVKSRKGGESDRQMVPTITNLLDLEEIEDLLIPSEEESFEPPHSDAFWGEGEASESSSEPKKLSRAAQAALKRHQERGYFTWCYY